MISFDGHTSSIHTVLKALASISRSTMSAILEMTQRRRVIFASDPTLTVTRWKHSGLLCDMTGGVVLVGFCTCDVALANVDISDIEYSL